ncbi:MAG: methyl-accepting chemotaxis protein [Planctomycetaceae bacterium]
MAETVRSRRPSKTDSTAAAQVAEKASILDALGKSQALIEFQMDGTIINANDNFLRTMGYSLSEIQGRHHSMFADDSLKNSSEYREFWAKLNRGEFHAGEFRRVAKGGREVWLQATYNPVVDNSGRPIKVVKLAADITAAAIAQQAAKVEVQRLVQVTDALSASQAMIEFQMDGTIVTANENFLNAMGYTLNEIKGRHHSMFVDEATRTSHEYRDFWARLNRGEFNAGEFKRIAKGRREVWIQATYNPVLDESGRPTRVVKYAADVTEQAIARNEAKEREDRMQKEQAAAKADLEGKVNSLMQVVQDAANGDLTKEIPFTGEDDMGRLAASMRKMFSDLRNVIGQVVEASNQQNEGARTIAESSANLSEGSQSQAASVEEMTASVEQLIESIQVISKNSVDAKSQAEDTSTLAKGGGTAVTEAVNAMKLIQKSSEQINDIIQVISEIASQTNLLALNAAIEAARAGEHGLGFAVVADEVRKLAERSSEAAKEITQLIKESSRRVEEGANLSEKVGQSLKSIVDAVDKTASGIARIAASTETQAASATQVKTAIRSVSQTTESNAAAAEEMAASAEELGAQAQSLRELVTKFKA